MVSGFPWLRWLVWLVLVGRLSGQVESAPNQAWLGVWAGELPPYGTVVLKVSAPAQDKPLKFELWWLFSEVPLAANSSDKPACQPRLEEGTLYLDRTRHSNYAGEVSPGLAFRHASPEEMRLASYGVLPPVMPPIWANLVLRKDPTGQAWNERKKNSAMLIEGKMTNQHGDIMKPLPASWPPEVVMPTTLLFSHNSRIFRICLAEANLPVDFLWTICAMAEEPSSGSFPTAVWGVLAGNRHTPTEVLDKIWAQRNELPAWYLAAANPNARPEWRAEVVERVMRGDDRLKMWAANLETGPAELYLRLVADGYDRRQQLANNQKLPEVVYESLVRDHLKETGDLLARNPGVPPAALDTLAASGSRAHQLTVLSNPALRAETKARLTRELVATATWRDYRHLSYHEGVPPEFLAKCAEDPDPWVRICVVRNPGTSQATLIRLAGDESTSVAWQAWEKLQERFPGTPGLIAPTISREATSLSPTVEEQCYRAVAANDPVRLKFLLNYLHEHNWRTFPYIVEKMAPEVVKEYRPEIMDLILASFPDWKEAPIVPLAETSAHDARWKAYFKGKGAFVGEAAGRLLEQALHEGRNDRLAALLAYGFDPRSKPSLLHTAVRMRNPAAVDLLLKAGADPSVVDQEKLTPLDYAVRDMLQPAIALLDAKGLYRDRVEAFTRAFPPAPDSRLQGSWASSGYPGITLILYPDGTGVMQLDNAHPMRVGWRPVGMNDAEGTKLTQEGGFGQEMTIRFRLDPSGNELDVTLPVYGQAVRLKRRANR